MDRKRGNRPDDIPGFTTEEADAQLRKYDHNIPYLQTVIYNLPKALKQFYPIAGEEVQDNDSDAGVTDSVKKNNKSDSRDARDKGQRRILQWLSPSKQEPSCSGTGRQNKRPEFRDSIRVKIISRTGKYVNIFPLITQDIPEDPSQINGAIINTSKQLLDVKLAEEDVLEKSALAQLLHAFYTEDEGKKRRTAIESKFLQPSSPSKAHNTKVTTLNVSYGGSDDYRTVHVSDRTLVGTIRFPYNFRGGAEKLVDDYARNRMLADLKLRYTAPVSILPVVDAVPREKNADGTPTPKRPRWLLSLLFSSANRTLFPSSFRRLSLRMSVMHNFRRNRENRTPMKVACLKLTPTGSDNPCLRKNCNDTRSSAFPNRKITPKQTRDSMQKAILVYLL